MAEKKENIMIIDNMNLMAEWDEEKNNSAGLFPYELTIGSNKKVWWMCKQGHEWQAVVSSRVTGGDGCPYCAGQRVVAGDNDLVTTNPEIASEWCYVKNGNSMPADFSAGSGKKIWWECASCNRVYQAAIYDRTNGKGCPYCAGQRVAPGLNDLESQNPRLAAEWNFEKNGDLLPSMVSHCSGEKVWWKCSRNHEWQAIVANRAKGRNCPYCANRRKV